MLLFDITLLQFACIIEEDDSDGSVSISAKFTENNVIFFIDSGSANIFHYNPV
jgi:hypothetical protein